MIAREESPSQYLELIASKLEDLSVLVGALADPEGGGAEPETPQGERARERNLQVTDIFVCWIEGLKAKRACMEAGGDRVTCYATGSIAEADCLREKVKEPLRKG